MAMMWSSTHTDHLYRRVVRYVSEGRPTSRELEGKFMFISRKRGTEVAFFSKSRLEVDSSFCHRNTSWITLFYVGGHFPEVIFFSFPR